MSSPRSKDSWSVEAAGRLAEAGCARTYLARVCSSVRCGGGSLRQSAKNKKPLNPVMGEVFLARTAAGSEDIFYYAEQVSHHPPGSMQLYEMPGKKLSMSCTFFPVAGFTGTGTVLRAPGPGTPWSPRTHWLVACWHCDAHARSPAYAGQRSDHHPCGRIQRGLRVPYASVVPAWHVSVPLASPCLFWHCRRRYRAYGRRARVDGSDGRRRRRRQA